MKILGWDIGIKNLSYCLIEVPEEKVKTGDFNYINCDIIKWDIIDLSTDPVKPHNSIKELIKDTTPSKASKAKPKKPKKKNVAKINVFTLCKKVEEIFDKVPEFSNVDYVVIENQPVLKNPTMKSVQMMVFSYFVFNKRTRHEVSMLNASNKMKVCKESIPEDISEKINKLKSKYSRNKKFSIVHTDIMLEKLYQDSKWVSQFKASKKKDDLADSFLMTLYFIFNKKKW